MAYVACRTNLPGAIRQRPAEQCVGVGAVHLDEQKALVFKQGLFRREVVLAIDLDVLCCLRAEIAEG